MSDKENKEYYEKKEVFKWYGWGSPIGLSIFLISCSIVIFLLACAGSLFVK